IILQLNSEMKLKMKLSQLFHSYFQHRFFQDTDALVRRRKLKNRLSIAAVVFAATAVSAVMIPHDLKVAKAAQHIVRIVDG
ncbi:MAG: hypothetical protein K2M91_16655, partial [Lachnospiraceae bacterium]|nr:hypothetical protein [Lachnospiraceae bacterium]